MRLADYASRTVDDDIHYNYQFPLRVQLPSNYPGEAIKRLHRARRLNFAVHGMVMPSQSELCQSSCFPESEKVLS